MKKILLTLALLLSLTWAAPASALGFDWGVTGGLNLTKLNVKGDYKQLISSDNRAGWFLGLKANVSIALGFGVDGSIVYSQQKYNLQPEGVSASTYDVSSKTMRSIAIPINLRYNIGIGSIASVYIATGPQFDFNVGDRDWDVFTDSFNGSLFKSENMTTSWNVGAGVKVLDRVEVGLAYNFGLSKVADSALSEVMGTSFKSDDLKANTFKVSLAVYF